MATRRRTARLPWTHVLVIGPMLVALAPGHGGGQPPARDSAFAGSCAEGRIGTRRGHAMTYDPISRGVVLFGGTSGDTTDGEPRSLWSWDGARWRCLSSDGPPGRDAPELAFDAERKRLVLHGGRTRGADRQLRILTDTWEWDGTRWTHIDAAGPPPRRLHPVIAYDPSRRAVILHGGLDTENRGRALSDTWRWTGERWEEIPVATPPDAAENHNALMSSGDGVMLLMQVKDSARCRPTERWQRAQAKVYELRGAAWTALTSDGPCVSGLPPAALTATGLVLVGASAPGAPWPSEAWRWQDRTWRRVASMPTTRRGARAAYDPGRGRVVLFGGEDAAGMLGDTWEWDGERWDRVDIR